MKNRIFSEDQILDAGFRKEVIKEITDTENVARKKDALRAHEIFRDKTKKWVIDSLAAENLHVDTVAMMENRAANISICRKIVKKLAQSYVNGVIRAVDESGSQEPIDKLTREMDINTIMKKTDQYMQLFKNTIVQVIPEVSSRESEAGRPKHRIKARVLTPYQYDVIEDMFDHEIPRCVVLTDFTERSRYDRLAIQEGTDGRQAVSSMPDTFEGDRKEQIIADSPQDRGQDHRTFIWWTDSYHLTTDEQGQVIDSITPEDFANPIGIMPFINFAEDQDGEFWAQGGDDLIDGSILTNKVITDMFAIAYIQGWGQMWIAGKDLPKKFETGPHNAILLNHDGEGPLPSVNFASANPPLDMWMQKIEQYVALLLSTNNLSPRNVSGKLDAGDFPSGIAMLIEQSESTADMQDRQKTFQDKEPLLWEVIRRWQELYFVRDLLVEDFKEIGTFSDSDVKLSFVSPHQVVTEKEKVEILKARKELGLDRMVDLLMRDNPGMTEEEAEEKLLKLTEEKLEKMAQFGIGGDNGMQENQEKEDQENEVEDEEPDEEPDEEAEPFGN